MGRKTEPLMILAAIYHPVATPVYCIKSISRTPISNYLNLKGQLTSERELKYLTIRLVFEDDYDCPKRTKSKDFIGD